MPPAWAAIVPVASAARCAAASMPRARPETTTRPSRAELGREPRRHPAAECRGVARPDQRHRRARRERRRRRAPRAAAAGRRWWRGAADSPARRAGAAGRRRRSAACHSASRLGARRRGVAGDPGLGGDARQRVEGRGGRAVLAQEADEGRGADPPRARQPQPVEPGRVGAGQGLGRDLGGRRGLHRAERCRAGVNAASTRAGAGVVMARSVAQGLTAISWTYDSCTSHAHRMRALVARAADQVHAPRGAGPTARRSPGSPSEAGSSACDGLIGPRRRGWARIATAARSGLERHPYPQRPGGSVSVRRRGGAVDTSRRRRARGRISGRRWRRRGGGSGDSSAARRRGISSSSHASSATTRAVRGTRA